ncbi:MAG: surface-adhesin E family protein [Smithella sp.]|jgi:hypothetical protein
MKSKNIQWIFFLGIFFLFASQALAEDWTYYDTALAGTMYYDKSNIFEAKKGVLSVWTKNILSTDSKNQYFSILNKIDKAPDDPSKLSYYRSLMEIDCTNKKFRYVHVVFYDEQDNIIHASSENETSEWNTIEPDSVGEKLMNLVSAEYAILKKTDVAEKVETPVTPEETVAVAKVAEPVPPKETAPVAKVTEPVAPKETAVAAKVTEPVYPKETAAAGRMADSVPPRETVIDVKVEKPVYPKQTVLAAKILESINPRETIIATRIEKTVPLKETVAVAKVVEPVPPKDTAVAALTIPDKKPVPDKSNQHETKAIPGKDDDKGVAVKGEDRRESGNIETGQKIGNREVVDQKIKLPAENRPTVSAAARETGRDGRFIAFDNQTVLDTKTNLIWAAKDNGRDINWYDAKRYCQTYRGGGYTDWRMPTKDELAQLYDARKTQRYEAQQNPLHLTELIRLSDCCPWSSQTRGSEAAYFDFSDGTYWWFLSPGTSINRVLPVREAK